MVVAGFVLSLIGLILGCSIGWLSWVGILPFVLSLVGTILSALSMKTPTREVWPLQVSSAVSSVWSYRAPFLSAVRFAHFAQFKTQPVRSRPYLRLSSDFRDNIANRKTGGNFPSVFSYFGENYGYQNLRI